MNSSTRRSSSRRPTALAPHLVWHHLGQAHRVTIWPEVAFEKEISPSLWVPYTPDPSSDAFTSGAVMLDKRRWSIFLEYFPTNWTRFIGRFSFHRLHALAALAYAPALQEDFAETPLLALLVAIHADLRGLAGAQWGELNALCERGSVFGVLEWLGLPSTRACLDQLGLIDPDLPVRDLSRVREMLWQQHDAAVRARVESHRGVALAA
jgi:hypothetical protein